MERKLGRRSFLKGAAVAPLLPAAAKAQTPEAPRRSVPDRVSPAAEGLTPAPAATAGSDARPASDYMIDVMRGLGVDTVAFVPGNTFKGLHESLINYGMLTDPKMAFVTVNHEETSVAFCHGYAKVTGKPAACMMHSTVGLQHGAMAIYNAWADRVPVYGIVAAQMTNAERFNMVSWEHAVFDGPGLVRDFTKWDATPLNLEDFSDAAVRAWQFAMTPPHGPVLLAIDQALQETTIPAGKTMALPRPPHTTPPAGDSGGVMEAAKMLAAAENPLIVADRLARTAEGVRLLVQLAELLQAAVIDTSARFNFPWRHPLNQSALRDVTIRKADVVLGLEMANFNDIIGPLPKSVRCIAISAEYLYKKANYQDFQAYADVDLAIAADAEATLPALIEAVRGLLAAGSSRADRGKALATAHANALTASRANAAVSWDAQPITTARLCQEIYAQIRKYDWALVNGTNFQNYWPQQLWQADKHYQYIGDAGAYGLGYLPGAALGAAFAHAPQGRLAVAIGGDGDLMFSPHMLWAAAHNRIPILYIIHNNRGYHQELMAVQDVANRRGRGIDRTQIGNVLTDPNIDFATMAKSMGVFGIGPITNPADLAAALTKAIAVVKAGEPALIDVISQGR